MNNANILKPPNVEKAIENVSSKTSNIMNKITNLFQNTGGYFASKGISGASADYINSNSIIAKLSFILLILIIFVLLYSFILAIVFYMTDKNVSPYLIKGISNGNDKSTISQDPKITDSIYILRSNNAATGAEFTWSVWLNINDVNDKPDINYSHIFNKGNSSYTGLNDKSDSSFVNNTTGIANVNNAPGVYITYGKDKKSINIRIVMDTNVDVTTNTTPYTYMDIINVPLKKWFHLCIRLQNIVLDGYINGALAKRVILNGAPRQNYNDVFICQNGGFNGQLADLRYFSRALNIFDINTLVWNGFNRNYNKKSPPESITLSNQWYLNNIS
jgi:hypothetical protein